MNCRIEKISERRTYGEIVLHFGAGQTETEITLKPGAHTLQLLMGDKDHIPHTPPVMSPLIRVNIYRSPMRAAVDPDVDSDSAGLGSTAVSL
jgi:uncharacterized protein DUF4399